MSKPGVRKYFADAFRTAFYVEDVIAIFAAVVLIGASISLIVFAKPEHAPIGIVTIGIIAWAFYARYKGLRRTTYTCGRCSMQWKERTATKGNLPECPRCGSNEVTG